MQTRLEVSCALFAGMALGWLLRDELPGRGRAARLLARVLAAIRRSTASAALSSSSDDSGNPLSLLALPPEILTRVVAELPMHEIARVAVLDHAFEDILEQAVRLRAPVLSGHVTPRWARSWSRGPTGRPMCPDLHALPRAVADWASELAACEALIDGRLTPGEYHFTIRTNDDGGQFSYFAYGQLNLYAASPDDAALGVANYCRGSAIEAAPDGMQVCLTRGGTWRPGGFPAANTSASAPAPPPSPSSLTLGEDTPVELYADSRHASIEFSYDYGGELYKYQLVGRTSLPPQHTDLSTITPLVPQGYAIAGPQLWLTGRWSRQAVDDDPADEHERGRVHLMRLWRAEGSYSLLPDDPDWVEGRLADMELQPARANMMG